MPYRLTREPDFMRLVFADDITPADLRALAGEVAAIERTFAVTPHRLTDLTRADGRTLTYPDILAFAEWRMANHFAIR
jgi:hypothetical protein